MEMQDIIICIAALGIPSIGYIVTIERRLSAIANDIKWIMRELLKSKNSNNKERGIKP